MFRECSVIEIPENEIDKFNWCHRCCNRNSAILVISERHVRLRMYPFLVVAVPSIIVKTHGDRNDVLRNDVSINFVILVDIGVVLKFFKVGCRKERKPVASKRSVSKRIHHLNQCTVKHFRVIYTILSKTMVNLVIGSILQGDRHVFSFVKSDQHKIVFA